jgi:Tim44-like domain
MTHRFGCVALTAFTALAFLAATDAGAARFGGGRSVGVQRPVTVTPRTSTQAPAVPSPSASASFNGPAADPVMPRGAATAPAAASAPTAPARPTAGPGSWLGPIAGLAAGLGIASLVSRSGASAAGAAILFVALFAIGGAALARVLVARKAAGAARPARGARDAFEPRFGSALAARAQPSHWPAEFDAERFAREALQQFRSLQRAYDNGDTAALAEVMTAELYTEAVRELRQRGLHVPTQFDSVAAEVIDVTTEADLFWVGVRFHGLAREGGATVAQPFDELWNLSKPTDGSSGWLVAGIQQTKVAA